MIPYKYLDADFNATSHKLYGGNSGICVGLSGVRVRYGAEIRAPRFGGHGRGATLARCRLNLPLRLVLTAQTLTGQGERPRRHWDWTAKATVRLEDPTLAGQHDGHKYRVSKHSDFSL